MRLDAEIVRRGLARSRQQAAELIAAGRVHVNGMPATKASTRVDAAGPLLVLPDERDPAYASRGAHKLAGALDALGALAPAVAGRVCLDAGASTGGFTDVLLRRGAALVHAVDVGYGQLAWALQSDARVVVHDRTNVRTLGPGDLDPVPDLVVADLSFISLRLVLPALKAVTAPQTQALVMVKPQFEVGKDRIGARGVVRDPDLRARAVLDVAGSAQEVGFAVRAVTRSPLPGPNGNVEFFLYLSTGEVAPASADDGEASLPRPADGAGATAAGSDDGPAPSTRPLPPALRGQDLERAVRQEVGES